MSNLTIHNGYIGLGNTGAVSGWKIGGTWDGGDFVGKIDECHFYGQVLSDEEI